MFRRQFDLSDHASSSSSALPQPPALLAAAAGARDADATLTSADASKELAAKQRQVMSLAYGPGKGILTTAFMLWMSGSSIQIFSIMATGMALVNPIKALGSVNKAFSRFEGEAGLDLFMPKAIFVALQLLALGVGVYKCSTMGLLPLTAADWTQYLPTQRFVEFAGFVL